MKKFTKMLALCMALALVFGMTVSAEGSGSKDTSSNETSSQNEEALANNVTVSGITVEGAESAVDLSAASVTRAETAIQNAAADIKQILSAAGIAAADKSVVFVGGVYLGGVGNNATLKITLPQIAVGKQYAVIHFNDDYTIKQVLPATVVRNGELSVSGVNGASPFGVVELVSNTRSPKTGATIPVAGILAVICLAGAVVCAKKVRYNK